VVCMGVAAACLVRGALDTPSAQGRLPGGMRPIAEHGFGDSRNSYAWSMAWFKGALYVGTARSAACVENATIVRYFPSAGSLRAPAGVRCPASIFDDDLRAEIWRYDPAPGRWTRVYRSPTIRNPRAPGKPLARDIGYRGMAVVRGAGGHRALYVGAVTADEIVPELARRHPPRLLRTTDGRHFRALAGDPGVIHGRVGPQRPIGYRAMAVDDGRLYVTASGGLTGDGVVVRVDHPAGRHPRYRQVSPRGMGVFELQPFAGRLYAGTGDPDQGYGVWQVDGRRASGWKPVLTGGAGRGPAITSVVSMAAYRGHLYVGASAWGTSLFPASELIRIAPDGSWDVVVGNAREGKVALSGFPDGFGNAFNSHFWRMQVYRGALLLGTNDWSWSLRGTAGAGELRSQFGFDLYGTCDGDAWWLASNDGFGTGDDFGVRTMAASRAGLFLGTTNHVDGTAVYRTRQPPCAGRTRAWSARARLATRRAVR
jgi:hypothetical protein